MSRSSSGSEDGRDVELSRLSTNVNMAGISLAIFAFVLLLYFSPHPGLAIYPYLFQATLGEIFVAVFAFSASALYNFVLVYTRPAKHPGFPSQSRRATNFFAIGLFLLLLEPPLTLFSIGLLVVAIPSLILVLVYVGLYFKADSTIRKIRSSHV
jgi:hypothetical protein